MNRVLIINDSRFESIILSDLLSQIGYNVLVSDEYNAVRQVQSFLPDVVLVNYTMKEIKGDKLIDKIKASAAETRCILTSSSILAPEDVSHNVDYILRTPANRYNLEAAINEVERRKIASIEEDIELKDFKERINRWKTKTSEDYEKPESPKEESRIEVSAAVEVQEEQEETIKFCPFCGHRFDEKQSEFAFCPFCGHKINKTS